MIRSIVMDVPANKFAELRTGMLVRGGETSPVFGPYPTIVNGSIRALSQRGEYESRDFVSIEPEEGGFKLELKGSPDDGSEKSRLSLSLSPIGGRYFDYLAHFVYLMERYGVAFSGPVKTFNESQAAALGLAWECNLQSVSRIQLKQFNTVMKAALSWSKAWERPASVSPKVLADNISTYCDELPHEFQAAAYNFISGDMAVSYGDIIPKPKE